MALILTPNPEPFMSNLPKPCAILSVFCLLSSLLAPPVWASGEVNIYSARKEDLIKPLLDDFSKQTGITVNLVTGKEEAYCNACRARAPTRPPMSC